MTATPVISIDALVKEYGGPGPLRISRLNVAAGDRLALGGLDAGAAEVLMHLVTGAVLPDAGDVRIDGRLTRDIETDTAWLASLDRFGMVTDRSVLFEELPAAASLALPMTLSIDPMSPDVRREVEALADLVGLGRERIDRPARALSRGDRWRVHLARGIAHAPRLLLLERPAAGVEAADERRALAAALRRAGEARGFGWLAVTDDPDFAEASGSRRLTLRGDVVRDAAPWRWLWRRKER